jgi:methyltransferase (TIGR00027 family)
LKQGRFSRTAHKVAIRRAAHQLFDQPKVLDDPLAVPIIGAEAAEKLRASPKERKHPVARAFRAFMVARSRYAEDQLAKAVEQGVAQCVVVGAGLDTFAYRNPHSTNLRVFEVDHPATQDWKLECLQAAGIAVPPSLRFVPVDFERQTLAAGLDHGGFDSGLPAFFSWLGVTPYLTRESCMATLRFIAQLPPGSGVAFDFAVDPKLLNLRQRLALHVISRRVLRLRANPFNSSSVPPHSPRNSGTWDFRAARYWERNKSTHAISRIAPMDCAFGVDWDSLSEPGCRSL